MRGACKCGSVKFTTSNPLQLVNCHCTLCRSINGTAFTSYVVTQLAELKFQTDIATLSMYPATENAIKHFCSTCGTPVYNSNSQYPGLAMVYLGTLTEHIDLTPGMNVYCSSKLEWVDTVSSIHSFADAPQRS